MGIGSGWSAIFSSGSFVSVISGTPFAKISTAFPTVSLLSQIGLCGLVDGTTKQVNISAQSTTTPGGATFGAIVQFIGTGDGSFCAIVGLSNQNAFQFGMNGSSKNIYVFINAAVTSSFTLSLNIPYFIAASVKSASTVNFVATNLVTGQIFSSATSTGTGLSTLQTTQNIGADWGGAGTGTHFADAYIATAMFAPSFTWMQALLMWAADPWSFWYPPRREAFVGKAAAAPSFIAAWALNRNVAVEGVAT